MKLVELIRLMLVFVVVGCATLAVNFPKVGAFCLFYVIGLLFSFGGGDSSVLGLTLYSIWMLLTFAVLLRLLAMLSCPDDGSVASMAKVGMCFGLVLGTPLSCIFIFSDPFVGLVIQSACCLVLAALFAGVTFAERAHSAAFKRFHLTRGL